MPEMSGAADAGFAPARERPPSGGGAGCASRVYRRIGEDVGDDPTFGRDMVAGLAYKSDPVCGKTWCAGSHRGRSARSSGGGRRYQLDLGLTRRGAFRNRVPKHG